MPSEILTMMTPHLPLLPALCLAFAVGAITTARAADSNSQIGVFDQHADIGAVGYSRYGCL